MKYHWFPLGQHSGRRLMQALRATALLLAGSMTFSATGQTPQTDLPRVRLQAGMHLIQAQVARTPVQRNIGLMWRQELAINEGMLFVFDSPATQCFWMKNTLLPLTAAFIDEDGTVVNLADMQPQTTTEHCSRKPVRFVLEMAQGWFTKHAIEPGFRIRGPVFSQ